MIGQSQVATALGNAIQQNRVGHAYLFTGARGVGKTSSARIFAKCLNCTEGPTIKPCGACDICLSVATGEDVDVLEIDGASNRGIDEIRQLRANANVRPSRARYKIYIIDEVHMLTVAAFNALLKTLEEPPQHVKFIFCTTDPEKIPITVLSRCQRFDFPPIKTAAIVERLRHIVDTESIEAEDKALELLARRAGGSMRDSQSLLEQLLSYSSHKITVTDVHGLLGTADNDAVFDIASAMVAGEPAQALTMVHESLDAGVDAGQLTDQLLGLFRDAMACLVGCGEELMLNCSADDLPRLNELAGALGVEKVLAILQVLDQSLVKARLSASVRTMLETAVVRCSHLQNLDQIPQLIEQLQSGAVAVPATRTPPARAAKKKPPTVDPEPPQAHPPQSQSEKPSPAVAPSIRSPQEVENPARSETGSNPALAPSPSPAPAVTEELAAEPATAVWAAANLEATWKDILAEFNDLTSDSAGNYASLQLDGERLTITLKSAVDQTMCDRPGAKERLEEALKQKTGQNIRLDFKVSEVLVKKPPRPQHISRRQRIRNAEQNEFIKSAMDMLDGEITDVQIPPG
ncbi:MAG: DNA polymerase III subunit gamma/tau [Pirellulaceae bacterium]|nr:DNA polymerase III subunit gamma/tau [Pirellulaceae bacterium]